MPTPPIDPQLIAEAHQLVAKYGSVTAAAHESGIPRSTLKRRYEQQAPRSAPTADTKSVASPKRVGKSLSDFRAEHDKDYIVPARIKSALKQLGDGWEYEFEFSRLAGVSSPDLATYREQFADYWVPVSRAGKRVWTGSKAVAEQMRAMVR